MGKEASPERARPRTGGQSSADFQSAVSQNCILQSVPTLEAATCIRGPADYKSAIQQIGNLRYFVTGPARPRVQPRPND
jgi:hypothetical protein